MPQYSPPRNYSGIGALLLIVGTCSVCGGAIQGFGDRMPNPPPNVLAQFEATNRLMGWMIGGGAVVAFCGIMLVVATISPGKTDFRNQKRD